MKKNKKATIMLIIFMIITNLLCSCGHSADLEMLYEENTENMEGYEAYSDEYWSSKSLPIAFTLSPNEEMPTISEDSLETPKVMMGTAPDEIFEMYKGCKKVIRKYFSEKYNLDVSKRLNFIYNIELFIEENCIGNTSTSGYVVDDDNTIYINAVIINDVDTLKSTMIHETLHAIGFKQFDHELQFMTEGLTDATTEQICEYAGEFFAGSDEYSYTRALSKQMIAVDDQLIINLLTKKDFNLHDYINQKLEGFEIKPAENVELDVDSVDLAQYLDIISTEICMGGIYGSIAPEWDYSLKFQGQEIIGAFCKSFKPTEDKIEQIREFYVFYNFEVNSSAIHTC